MVDKKQKKHLLRISICTLLFLVGVLVPVTGLKYLFMMLSYLYAGYDVIIPAVKKIGRGQLFDENFLMTVATFGAIAIGELSEAVFVMVLFQLGEWFQNYAVNKSRTSIAELMEIMPDKATVLRNGAELECDPDDVEVGETILVRPGEKVPLDGIVIEGESFVDTSALTGESIPRRVIEGDDILSGCINDKGLLKIKTTKEFEDCTVAKILELVEDASSNKARYEKFITRFARYYTPVVVMAAVALAILPVILGSVVPFSEWVRRACMFLVISCPCALVISVPLGFFGGIGAAAKNGILVKGSNYIELLSKIETMVFDKTGTITKGTFDVVKINAVDGDHEELLKTVAYGELYSNHPIAESVKKAYGKSLDGEKISDYQEISGKGISVIIDGMEVLLGNRILMEENQIEVESAEEIGTTIYAAKNGQFLGYIVIRDEIKETSKNIGKVLKEKGIDKTVMLTGDRREIANMVAMEAGIDQVESELLPADKVEKLEGILNASQSGKVTAYAGDGINDAPVLMRADIGIAMGALGSDAAIEAADVVIMDDDLGRIVDAVAISRKTVAIVKENIVFALGIKGLFLLLGAFGITNLWIAIFGDVGVAFIAILNSMRTLKFK